jgi:hypothetical protein
MKKSPSSNKMNCNQSIPETIWEGEEDEDSIDNKQQKKL